MIGKKYIAIATLAIVAMIGAAVTTLNLSADKHESPATPVVEDNNANSDMNYCDTRSGGITVQGMGIVTIPANIGVIELGVDVIDNPLVDARSTAAATMQKVIDAIKEQGIAEDQIVTTRLNIQPETTWVEQEFDLGDGTTELRGRPVIIGYRVSNRVRVEVDVAEMSEEDASSIISSVIDASTTAGGDHVRIDSIYFKADESSESLDKARKLAVQDALHRAKIYADAFDVKVGTLLNASETVSSTPVYDDSLFAFARAEATSFDGPSTPISTGDVEIRASITATLAIQIPQSCFISEASIGSSEASISSDTDEGS